MNVKGLLDCHTHCMFSPDGKDNPALLIDKAIRLGLKVLAVTDHCECNTWFRPEHYGIDVKTADKDDILMYNCKEFYEKSLERMAELKQRHYEGFEFIHGAELGQPLQAPEIAKQLISEPQLDFILGSLHNNKGMPDFYYLEYDKMSSLEIKDLLDDYFEQVLEMCRWGGFDILSHLTYPLRYICGKYKINVDLSKYRDICAEIFKTVIASGKGIEINTSGLFNDLNDTMPDEELVRLYKDIGGEIISLGSDAHCAANVGQGIDVGAQIAKNCGFKYAAYFKQHKPQFITL